MENGVRRRQWSIVASLAVVLQLCMVIDCSLETPARRLLGDINSQERRSLLGVQLHQQDKHVVMDNGLVRVTLSNPEGMVTGIQYKGIDNVLEGQNGEDDRGYWDINWNEPGSSDRLDRIKGKTFRVIREDENQIELSFTTTWHRSPANSELPLNIDKRYIMLRGSSGFYAYAIYERLKGWPDLNVDQSRIAFKLQRDKFHYMAISDDRQRIMPMARDREIGRPLAYPEAVLLTDPVNPDLKGEVDDKYQYSCDDKDTRVHGWISFNPAVGFWVITPSNEFRVGGPVKQDLTSHVGPITLSMFMSNHYAGSEMEMQFRDGEPWKKVFGPVFVYLNSADKNPLSLWEDAKKQMWKEVENWPYSFPLSEDFPSSDQRGSVRGQLQVYDWYVSEVNKPAAFAYVGLAAPGEAGSWQTETKGYQFWVQADAEGHFFIKGIRAGTYNLYAWVSGAIGDYKYEVNLSITPGREINLDVLVFKPIRDGPTFWEIGIPDRTAAEFFVPAPNPTLMNHLYNDHPTERFRQYGLWQRYGELYPDQDLIYKVGVSDYRTDWFFAHVTRNTGNGKYEATTWKILFELQNVIKAGTYKLRLALAAASISELQVRFNDPHADPPHFTTGLIGKDNAIARHGIHGLYWLYHIDVPSSQLFTGSNTIFLTQSRTSGPFAGLMYDYIRFEGPPGKN